MSDAHAVELVGWRFYLDRLETRLPFRFGITTMRQAPKLLLEVEIRDESGSTTKGFSADLLVPKWFEKDPNKSADEDVHNLIESARCAARAWSKLGIGSVFGRWYETYEERVRRLPADSPSRLVHGFGVALVERAIIDAWCRMNELSFFDALRGEGLGFRPGLVHAELHGWSLADALASGPATSVKLRHTVGLADPLTDADEIEGEPDGLPRTLVDNIRRYGLDTFKIKLCGDAAIDGPRLARIGEILMDETGGVPLWTVDGNEQFADAGDLALFLDEFERTPVGSRFLAGLAYVEQPLSRKISFDQSQRAGIERLSDRVPIILDEADHGLSAFPRGLELGYQGVSIKNCKGVFRSLLNRGLCDMHDGHAFQSAEDLTNLGVLALNQDLATVAALGLPHVERNGHHYFRGLDHLPEREAEAALANHPGLYTRTEERIALRIEDGRLDLRSLDTVGFGYAVDIRTDERTRLE